jgi:hypothetical protein
MRLLEDEEWSQWSDREIARRCTVGVDMVDWLRGDTVAERQSEHRVHVHQKSGAIGRMPSPAPNENGEAVFRSPRRVLSRPQRCDRPHLQAFGLILTSANWPGFSASFACAPTKSRRVRARRAGSHKHQRRPRS